MSDCVSARHEARNNLHLNRRWFFPLSSLQVRHDNVVGPVEPSSVAGPPSRRTCMVLKGGDWIGDRVIIRFDMNMERSAKTGDFFAMDVKGLFDVKLGRQLRGGGGDGASSRRNDVMIVRRCWRSLWLALASYDSSR